MRKQKIYIGRRRKNRPRAIPWFMKRIRMTFTERHDGPVSRFLDQWSSLVIKEQSDRGDLERDYFNEWTTEDRGKERPTRPFSDKVFHIDFSSHSLGSKQ